MGFNGIRAFAPAVLLFILTAAANFAHAQTVLYSEDFESSTSLSNWTITSASTTALWHRTSNCGRPGYCLGYCQAETQNWTTPNGNYNTTVPNQGLAASPPITLSGGTRYALSLDMFNWNENLATADILSIGIGTTPYLMDTVLYEDGLWHIAYSREAWNISSFSGQTIYVIFKFDTVDAANNNFPGARIDNVRVEASTSLAPVLQTPMAGNDKAGVLITEVAQDPGPTADEYFELTNVSDGAVDISGWKFTIYSNASTTVINTTMLGTVLDPGESWVLCDMLTQTYTSQSEFIGMGISSWQNYGIALFNAQATLVDFVCFGSFNAAAVTSPQAVGSHWSGSAAPNPATVDNSSKRSGTADSNSAADWSTTTGDTLGTANSGLTLPFGEEFITVGGTDPNFTGTCEVDHELGMIFEAFDPQAYDTISIAVIVTGGSLTPAQAGFTGSFPYQVSGKAVPVRAILGGVALTDGTIDFNIVVSDGVSSDSYTFNLTIDPPPPCEIDIKNATSASVASGGTDTLSTALPAGFTENVVYTIENLDTGDLDLTGTPAVVFANEQNCAVSINQPAVTTIVGFASENFDIDITPTAAGAWSVEISIDNNDVNENPYTWTISGTAATPQPEIDVQRGGNTIAVGGTDSVAGTQAGGYLQLAYTIWNWDVATLNLTGNPPVLVSAPTNCNAVVALQPATSIAGNNYSYFEVDLTPTAAGAWSFAVTIDNDDPDENPYTFTVQGNAQSTPAPDMDLQRPAGTSIAVAATDNVAGTVMAVSTTLNYTIENVGALDLTLTNSVQISNLNNCSATLTQAPSSPIASAASTTFIIEVTPTAVGAWSFDASIDNNDPDENPYTWVVGGNAQSTPGPEIDVQRPQGVSIASGSVDSGHTGVAGVLFTLTYTIENQGNMDLNLTGTPPVVVANMVNCTVSIAAQPSTPVAIGATTTFSVDVTPVAAGTFSFDVSIDNDDANENPYAFTADGTAQPTAAPEIDVLRSGVSVPTGSNENIANTTASTTVTLTFSIENQGNADLGLSGTPPVLLSGLANCSAAVVSQPNSVVAPAGSTGFSIDVTPQSAGAWSVGVSIDNDDANENPYTFTLSGNAQPAPAPEIEVRRDSGTAILNGSVDDRPGLSGVQTLVYTVHNFGNAPLTISAVTVAGFVDCTAVVTQQPSQPIAVNGVGVIEIEVTPPPAGTFGFNVSISNDDPNENPYEFVFVGATFNQIEKGDGKKEDEACSANPGAGFAWLLALLPTAILALSARHRPNRIRPVK